MCYDNSSFDDISLILAAEDCPRDNFSDFHVFSKYEKRIISKLIAHGPVLLRGGRGSGKSALMIQASLDVFPANQASPVLGIYLSLRHLELLRSEGEKYEKYLCERIIGETQNAIKDCEYHFSADPNITSLQKELSKLSEYFKKRIVLFFDDAAHIGREAPLHEFFDIFRTLSSSLISCKASIYPGVTQFGTRFDVYNDATVIDISRNEELPGFNEPFSEIIQKRFANELPLNAFSNEFGLNDVAGFLGRAVIGNMRGFLFACNALAKRRTDSSIGFKNISDSLIDLSQNYYWPLLDELRPKLGIYEPMIEPAINIAENLFESCGEKTKKSALIYRNIIQKLSKPFEMLEYTGFIAKRDVSRAMKSRGRGSRYVLNLCVLLENIPKTRLTSELYEQWTQPREDPLEFHRGSNLYQIDLPKESDLGEPAILSYSIEKIIKSKAYPYGLTLQKITVLKEAGYKTVGDLMAASDEELKRLNSIGDQTLERFRNTIMQAIWM